jgi:hypothetical protein
MLENQLITKEEYNDALYGYNILGCTVRSKDIFVFVAQEDYTSNSNGDHEIPEDDSLRQRVVNAGRPMARRFE